jgi:hypothetical protein
MGHSVETSMGYCNLDEAEQLEYETDDEEDTPIAQRKGKEKVEEAESSTLNTPEQTETKNEASTSKNETEVVPRKELTLYEKMTETIKLYLAEQEKAAKLQEFLKKIEKELKESMKKVDEYEDQILEMVDQKNAGK